VPQEKNKMNVIDKILSTPGRYDNPIREFKVSDFGRYVLTWLGPPKQYMVGKLVQVRLEAGAYGSDMVLLRQSDNVLIRHENQNFYSISESFAKELDTLFSKVDQDSVEIEYTLANGEQPEIGFIIPSTILDGESTPMRDVLNACKHQIAKLITETESPSMAKSAPENTSESAIYNSQQANYAMSKPTA
jgi:hypothetical protein